MNADPHKPPEHVLRADQEAHLSAMDRAASDRGDGIAARIPTGAKVFLILSAALLPLALIALFATLQTNRTADSEARAQLRLAAVESARSLSIELIGDMNVLREAVDALEADPANAPVCARARGVFAQQFAAGTGFAITDTQGRLLCGTAIEDAIAPSFGEVGEGVVTRITDRGLLLAVVGRGRRLSATAFFPTRFLAVVSSPGVSLIAHGTQLRHDDAALTLTELPGRSPLERRDSQVVPVGIAGLSLAMTIRAAPITSPLLIAMLLPLLMWAAAAGIAWFVVDRLLIRPLRRLRTSVGSYRPGEALVPVQYGTVPAQEIRQLGETFQDITRTVALHEADLAQGLLRQTKLTREVHHRVKNNLQVIASLINFHSRGASTPEAAGAYASIQRRVDALAVVHRHHFAEMEDTRGLELRSVIGELASNIRATAPASTSKLGVVLEIEPLLVTQDVAVAVAFLLTELIELAMSANPQTQLRISMAAGTHDRIATLRLSSSSLITSAALETLIDTRYGRIVTGLARQLRAPLHYDPLVGAYEISIAVTGRA